MNIYVWLSAFKEYERAPHIKDIHNAYVDDINWGNRAL